ncbi:four helix bundle protein [Candidatus Falkowbacteria bacterium]|nr:four helix bundle protein [Candidatus Falkowbacteria bacterium]
MPQPLREAPLIKAQAKCQLLKLLIRLSFELNLIKSTQYFQLSTDLKEIGKMLGGWINYARSGLSQKTTD